MLTHILFAITVVFVYNKDMTYRAAAKMLEAFTLDRDYNIVINGAKLDDSMCKAYVYANIYFFDEVQKELIKLSQMIEKLYEDVTMELGMTDPDPLKLFFEISTRAHRQIGDDGLDSMIKEFLAEKKRHIALMVDQREQMKFHQICEAIFLELVGAFYTMTIHSATDFEPGVKTFKFSAEYIASMTERQKTLVAPALRMVGLENRIALGNLQISQTFAVRYTPTDTEESFLKQEDTIKDQIKNFINKNS